MLTPEQNHELHTLHIRRMDILSKTSWLIVLLVVLLWSWHRIELRLFYRDVEKLQADNLLQFRELQGAYDERTELRKMIFKLQEKVKAHETWLEIWKSGKSEKE